MTTTNKLFKLKIERPRNIKNDILSGLTVALALVPEAVARTGGRDEGRQVAPNVAQCKELAGL